jgi:excinuclease ABC subunit A
MLLARIVDNRKGEHRELLADAVAAGFARFRIDGKVVRGDELPGLDKKKKHTIDIVVDRLVVPEGDEAGFRTRLADSVEAALAKGKGLLIVDLGGGKERLYSEQLHCHTCDLGFPELSPQSFSFNSPLGMCPDCNGLGTKPEMDPTLVVPDPSLSVNEGAIAPYAKMIGKSESWTGSLVHNLARAYKIDFDKPWNKLSKTHRDLLLRGTKGKRIAHSVKFSTGKIEFERAFEGVLNELYRRFRQTKSEGMRRWYMRYLSEAQCSACAGQRLRPESRAVLLGGRSLPEIAGSTIAEARSWLLALELDANATTIAEEVLKEIHSRLGFLADVGLAYLTLDRPGPSLSGGESQRIRLASQIGSELTGVLYVLDEPSIGLHQRDNGRLLRTLERLRDLGNSVIVVEHDQETIESADWVLDFGPGAGIHGGEIVAAGTPTQIRRSRRSVTGQYLSGKQSIETPRRRRKGSGKRLRIEGARANNLADIAVDFPLETMVAVTGVSGAGKSTLVNSILYPALRRALHASNDVPGDHDRVMGVGLVDKVIDIDQRPIGRTPRSNPATYTKVFDEIRSVFASTAEARAFGYKKGRFSFNVKGGRCEACQGEGIIQIEMQLQPDVYVPCEVCKGKRYNREALEIQ